MSWVQSLVPYNSRLGREFMPSQKQLEDGSYRYQVNLGHLVSLKPASIGFMCIFRRRKQKEGKEGREGVKEDVILPLIPALTRQRQAELLYVDLAQLEQ